MPIRPATPAPAWALAAVLCLAPGTLRADGASAPTSRAWQGDHAHYAIDARLDAERHEVQGRLHLHFPNHGAAPLTTLELHLYANAFAHDATVFMREQGYTLRGTRLTRWGGIEVLAMTTAGGDDLLAGAAHTLSPGDRTQLRVHLPQPLPPGAALDVVMNFRTRLPNMVARMGYLGRFHMLGQWFPKLAKLRPDGSWDNFPYHGMGEFHADFADYDVTLDVPADLEVAGSGRRMHRRRSAGRAVWRFEARRVHDAAYVAAPGLQRSTGLHHGVAVEVVHPPGYGPAARRQRALIDAGLRHFGAAFGRYAWDHLTVLIPPANAHAVGAMEYPTFIVTGGPWWALPDRWPHPAHDLVTAHELAHQWFHGVVASHEVDEPMLDEGLAQWASLELLDQRYRSAPWLTRALGRGLDVFDIVALTDRTFQGKPLSSMLPAHAYDSEQLARSIYVIPPLVLETVSRVWGTRRLRAALGAYARSHRFGHATTGDLFAAFDRVYWRGFSRDVLRPALRGERTGATVERVERVEQAQRNGSAARWRARRDGVLPVPLQVRVDRPSGHPAHLSHLSWPARVATFEPPSTAQRIVVDPGRRDLLARRQDLRAGIARTSSDRKWTSHLLYWAQQLLLLVGP